jgi:hypothetical protein
MFVEIPLMILFLMFTLLGVLHGAVRRARRMKQWPGRCWRQVDAAEVLFFRDSVHVKNDLQR